MEMKIKYDTQIEVTEKQYRRSMNELCGCICGRIEDGKFFIKLWVMSYSQELKEILN